MMKKHLIFLGYLVFTSCLVRAQLEQLQCEKEGFAVVQSTNCSSYYYCVRSANNEFYPIEFKCPSGEEFSLVLLKCIPEEENECGKLPGTLVEDPILTEEFVCPSQGRFPDVESLDCKSYFTCAADLIPARNTCPSVTIFSWTAMKCVMPDTFTCPNSVVTTTEEPTTTKAPDGFVCTGEGRFADPQTVDCKTYYLCTKTPSGTVEASLNQCPSTTIFSSISSKCVTQENYVCPSTVSPTSTVEPTSTDPATEPTTEVSTEKSTDSESTDTVEPPTSELVTDDLEVSPSSTEPPTSSELPTEPTATESSTQDPTNETETTTALVTDDVEQSTSTTVSTSTEEPTTEPATESTAAPPTEGSTQEPTASETTETIELTTADTTMETTIAETTEEVTHSVSVTHTEEQSTIQVSTSEAATEVVTTPEPTVEETTVSVTTPTEESTTTETSTKVPSEPFTCDGKGRYPDPASSDCKSYYLCSENEEGIIEATLNQCPTVTVFDSVKLKCVLPTDYQCSQGVSTTTEVTEEPITNEVTTEVTVAETPSTVTEEQSTIQASTSEATTEVVTTLEPTVEETTVSATTHAVESTTAETTTKEPSESFTCAEKGRYPDPASKDCKSYYLCSENADGTIEGTLNQCPTVTVFDSVKLKCVLPTEYQCSQEVTTTTAVTEEPITTEVTTPQPPTTEAFACPSSGRFPDLTSTDCKRYYLCSGIAGGAFEAVLTQCPGTTLFSLESNRCVLSTQYQCPTNMPSTEPVAPSTTETTVSTTVPSGGTDKFSCKSVGRQPDPSQPDCTKYKYCLLTATNEFLEYTFYCPEGTYFDPTNFRCSISYNCPPPQTTISTKAAAEPTVATPFVCTTNGRYSNPLSTGCVAYIMCLVTATGDVLQYNFECPSGYRFNPTEAKCASDYVCV
ncbi:mucin-2 [Aedes albopictus]|uniref:Chitin-binding type-2 domain-containing protein n=2 Tax=Aedes albopictus TaxID=7160 RepID=A0ABM1ZZP4_AEDAL